MKSLQKFVTNYMGEGFYIVPLTFKHAAAGVKDKRKGYAVYGPSSNPFSTNKIEYLTFEPCNYSNGDKWLIYGYLLNLKGSGICKYAANINAAINKVKKECSF